MDFGFGGPPQFTASGQYIGPLPPPSPTTHTMVRQAHDTAFRSPATAAYPPKLCKAMAQMLVDSHLDHLWGNPQPLNWPPQVPIPIGGGAPQMTAHSGNDQMAVQDRLTRVPESAETLRPPQSEEEQTSDDDEQPWHDDQKKGDGWKGRGQLIRVLFSYYYCLLSWNSGLGKWATSSAGVQGWQWAECVGWASGRPQS